MTELQQRIREPVRKTVLSRPIQTRTPALCQESWHGTLFVPMSPLLHQFPRPYCCGSVGWSRRGFPAVHIQLSTVNR